jgi:hypothetical protein
VTLQKYPAAAPVNYVGYFPQQQMKGARLIHHPLLFLAVHRFMFLFSLHIFSSGRPDARLTPSASIRSPSGDISTTQTSLKSVIANLGNFVQTSLPLSDIHSTGIAL